MICYWVLILNMDPYGPSAHKIQKKDKILNTPLAMPTMMRIPRQEPTIRRIVPSILPFLRKKLTMLAERIPKPRMGSAEIRTSPTSPKDITFLRRGLSFKLAMTLSVFRVSHRMGKNFLLECSKIIP